jgi:hypothetical protein
MDAWKAYITSAGYGKTATLVSMYLQYSADPLPQQTLAAVADARCREAVMLDEMRAALYAYERIAAERLPGLISDFPTSIRPVVTRAGNAAGAEAHLRLNQSTGHSPRRDQLQLNSRTVSAAAA